MKQTFFLLSIMAMGLNSSMLMAATAKNAKQKTICERLYDLAEDNCTEAMCAQQIKDFDDSECVKDGDFYEGLQICASEGEFPDLIEAYNKKHPREKINCDE